jgi:membrane fusion protein
MTFLFREEALKANAGSEWGIPIACLPPSWHWLTLFFLVCAIATVVFLSTAQIARKETASGILSLSLGDIRIVPSKSGTISEIYVKEGESVEIGAPLLQISTEQDLASSTLSQSLTDSLNAQVTALREQLDALGSAAPKEQLALIQRLKGEQKQLFAMRQSLPQRAERVAVARTAYELGLTSLASGAISGDHERQRQVDYLAQQQSMAEFNAQMAQLDGLAAQDSASLSKLPSDQAQARAKLMEAIAALGEKQSSVTGSRGYLVKAKLAGRVTTLQAKRGQLADTARPLMTIVPVGSKLQAEVYVPSRAIGFIRSGLKVRLVYEAFPLEQFGPAFGMVEEVSSAVLKPDEIGAALTVKEPVYRVIVRPMKTTVKAYGFDVPLRSGMALTADIVLEERSFLKLILDPLLAARGHIFSSN